MSKPRTKSKNKKILVVPGEDGFGPSALLSYVLKELQTREPGWHFTVWNESRHRYNQGLYREGIKSGNTEILAVWNIIQLAKEQGNVSIPQTLRRIGDYRWMSSHFPFEPPETTFDLLVEFGVPAAAKWAAKQGIPAVGIFDHSWSKTLRMILEEEDRQYPGMARPSDSYRVEWHKLADDIEKDERLTQTLYMFPEFIAPAIFYDHWKQLIGASGVQRFSSVLGGVSEPEEARMRAYESLETGCRRFAADGNTESLAHHDLERLKQEKVILIQGGDTPAWDGILLNLLPALAAHEKKLEKAALNVLVYVPQRLTAQVAQLSGLAGKQRILKLNPVPGETIQGLLPAVDFLVTRAGGGTVNDAVACRVPFVCVEEPTQPQVQAIMNACIARGFTRSIAPGDFEKHPLPVILEEFHKTVENESIIAAMSRVPNRGEIELIDKIRETLTF
jgi:hypothetical protein